MKKIILLSCALILGVGSAFAQKGSKAVGLNLGYGTEIKSLGIGGKFQYSILDELRIEPSMNFYMKKKGLSMWDASFNVHYLVPLMQNLKMYPIFGLTYTKWKQKNVLEGSKIQNNFGANIGVGAEYHLSYNFLVNLDVKYQAVKKYGQAVFTFGAAYKF